jgi:mono/diheme cytochrome c family protein
MARFANAPAANAEKRQIETTFEKFLLRAEAGDADAQQLIGFMLYFGEGAAQNWSEAQFWFRRAARQGNTTAQLGLAIMYYLGTGVPRDVAEAEIFYAAARQSTGAQAQDSLPARWPERLADAVKLMRDTKPQRNLRGQSTYEVFCAGCHGLNGIATYVGSPSFAIGESMEKSDADLLFSIANGKGMMPTWSAQLSPEDRVLVLAYIRTLRHRMRSGIAMVLRDAPPIYFLFGPMRDTELSRFGPE